MTSAELEKIARDLLDKVRDGPASKEAIATTGTGYAVLALLRFLRESELSHYSNVTATTDPFTFDSLDELLDGQA